MLFPCYHCNCRWSTAMGLPHARFPPPFSLPQIPRNGYFPYLRPPRFLHFLKISTRILLCQFTIATLGLQILGIPSFHFSTLTCEANAFLCILWLRVKSVVGFEMQSVIRWTIWDNIVSLMLQRVEDKGEMFGSLAQVGGQVIWFAVLWCLGVG